ncbi:hypothetical protein RvY_11490 [Ramazzottius varieornatus]|uniref:Receptor ligand binding region domain-containing protein n=1 Tax=Ramazzottius varieornatus TaxID=947166 RepID=A0A1D1VGC0_RAMVA|nr:hypothetical protein RvY_11490 [Ramazzottius varieornatus]
MDLLLLASTSSDVAFMNKQRFPTFVSFCPTGKGGQVPGLILFLKKYGWTTISVFCEALSNYFNVASVFGLHCRAIKNLLITPSSGFTVNDDSLAAYEAVDAFAMVCTLINVERNGVLLIHPNLLPETLYFDLP